MHQVELGSVVRIIMLKALVFYHLLHRSAHRTEAWILKTLDAWDSFTDFPGISQAVKFTQQKA